MGYFQTFLTDIQEYFPKYDNRLKSLNFRNYIIQTKGKNLGTIKLFKNSLISTLHKHQRCLLDHDKYYIANDIKTNTFYICFKNLLMLDIDFKDSNKDKSLIELLNVIEAYCQINPDILFDVFKSGNGIHLFAIHKEYDHKSDEALNLMLDCNCDFYYIIFSYIRGWSVRLNKKKHEINETDIYTYIKRLGKGKPDPKLEKLVKIHTNNMKIFQVEEACEMR